METKTTPMPADTVEKGSKATDLRIFNLDNTWTGYGVMAAYNAEEDEMTICAESKKPLFFTDRTGRRFLLSSFGFCVQNGKPYAAECLRMSDDVSASPFPLEYCGYHSKEEYAKPLTPEELA